MARGQSCAFDTLAVTRPDTVVLGLSAAGPTLLPSSGPPEAVTAAEAIARHFVAPQSMSLPLWARIHDAPGGGRPSSLPRFQVGHGLDEFVHLTLRNDGRLADRNVDVSTASPEFSEALRSAILRADSAGDLPSPGDALRRSGGRITLRVVDPDKPSVPTFMLMTVRLNVLQADRNVKLLKMPPVRYPPSAQRADVPDDVFIQYVVGADGRADPNERYHILQARYGDFTAAVLEALPGASYEPAQVAGCPVPTMVWQPFSFRMRPRHD